MRMDDLIRIYADLDTFTSEDVSSALECPPSTAQSQLYRMEQRGVVERVRVGHTFLYSLSAKGRKRLTRLKSLNPDERCLLLVWLPDEPVKPEGEG